MLSNLWSILFGERSTKTSKIIVVLFLILFGARGYRFFAANVAEESVRNDQSAVSVPARSLEVLGIEEEAAPILEIAEGDRVVADELVGRVQGTPITISGTPGERFSLSLRVENLSGRSWQSRDEIAINTVGDASSWYDPSWHTRLRPRLFEETVVPGATAEFAFDIQLPNTVGGYTFPIVVSHRVQDDFLRVLGTYTVITAIVEEDSSDEPPVLQVLGDTVRGDNTAPPDFTGTGGPIEDDMNEPEDRIVSDDDGQGTPPAQVPQPPVDTPPKPSDPPSAQASGLFTNGLSGGSSIGDSTGGDGDNTTTDTEQVDVYDEPESEAEMTSETNETENDETEVDDLDTESETETESDAGEDNVEAEVESETDTETDTETSEQTSSGPVIISEIAWMGTAASARDEWIELANISGVSVDLTDWFLRWDYDAEADTFGREHLLDGVIIPAGGAVILERTDDDTVLDIDAALTYTGALGNNGELIELVNAEGVVVDVVDGSGGWFAGDNDTKQTMVRYATEEQMAQRIISHGSLPASWCSWSLCEEGNVLEGMRRGQDADGENIQGSPAGIGSRIIEEVEGDQIDPPEEEPTTEE